MPTSVKDKNLWEKAKVLAKKQGKDDDSEASYHAYVVSIYKKLGGRFKAGKPDGTGPHGRGNGPGKGKADGSGLVTTIRKANGISMPGTRGGRIIGYTSSGTPIYSSHQSSKHSRKYKERYQATRKKAKSMYSGHLGKLKKACANQIKKYGKAALSHYDNDDAINTHAEHDAYLDELRERNKGMKKAIVFSAGDSKKPKTRIVKKPLNKALKWVTISDESSPLNNRRIPLNSKSGKVDFGLAKKEGYNYNKKLVEAFKKDRTPESIKQRAERRGYMTEHEYQSKKQKESNREASKLSILKDRYKKISNPYMKESLRRQIKELGGKISDKKEDKPEKRKIVQPAKQTSENKNQKQKMNPKEEKKYVLNQIDQALKTVDENAKVQTKENPKYKQYNIRNQEHKYVIDKEKTPMIEIKVPNGPTFNVPHVKESLEELKKRMKKMYPSDNKIKPIVPSGKLGTPRKNSKRLSANKSQLASANERYSEDLAYYNEYKPKKEGLVNENKTGKYVQDNGFYSDTHHFIKSDKKAKGSNRKIEHPIKRILDTVRDHSKIPVKFMGEYKEMGGTPRVNLIDENDNSIILNAKYVDSIMTKYPDAKPYNLSGGTFDDNLVVFESNGEIVGGVMAIVGKIDEKLRESRERFGIKKAFILFLDLMRKAGVDFSDDKELKSYSLFG